MVISPEKKFIHDLSGLTGIVFLILEDLHTNSSIQDKGQIEQAMQVLQKITELISRRREEILNTIAPTV